LKGAKQLGHTGITLRTPNPLRRRLMLAGLSLPVMPVLPGCAPPLRDLSQPATAAQARALLEASAAAHGAGALAGINDINVRYAGHWRAVIDRLQPALVDAGHRGISEERLLLPASTIAQAFTGPRGRKQVTRHTRPGGQGDVRVWFDGEEAHDAERRAAAALVADGYSLFLMGPMLLAGHWSVERSLVMELDGAVRISQDGRHHQCEVLRIRMEPGLGFSGADQLALFIDVDERLMRRVRFSLNGLGSTQGAIAEVELQDHVTHHGVRWPTRFYERLLRPLPLPVHNWTLAGLDVNRGLTDADVEGPAFGPRAEPPAAAL